MPLLLRVSLFFFLLGPSFGLANELVIRLPLSRDVDEVSIYYLDDDRGRALLTIQHPNPDHIDREDPLYLYPRVRLPESFFSEAEISELKELTDYFWDLSGGKTREVLRFANARLKLEILEDESASNNWLEIRRVDRGTRGPLDDPRISQTETN